MKANVMPITHSAAWQELTARREELSTRHLRELFAEDPDRFARLSLSVDGLLADFSKQRIDGRTLELLIELARSADIGAGASACLRASRSTPARTGPSCTRRCVTSSSPFPTADHDVMPEVREVRADAGLLRAGAGGLWRGFSGEAIRDVVNIGIGGSDLGPKMVVRALSAYQRAGLRMHFVSNLDSAHLAPLLDSLDPRSTLFIVASKTFTTQETMLNAHTARQWLCAAAGEQAARALPLHFVAVSSAVDKVREFGLPPENIFRMWDWVGGRYSLWSAVGLPIALAIGMTGFERLLAGAQAMDNHFCHAPSSATCRC
jgi:glucose-6-phosphate isomerase